MTNARTIIVSTMALCLAWMMIPLAGAEALAASGELPASQHGPGVLVANCDTGVTLPLVLIGRCAPGHGPA